MKEEGNADQLLNHLHPVVTVSKMRELVQQTGAAVPLGPRLPVGGNQDHRLPAAHCHGRSDCGMSGQLDRPGQQERPTAVAEQPLRIIAQGSARAPEPDEYKPAGDKPNEKHQHPESP